MKRSGGMDDLYLHKIKLIRLRRWRVAINEYSSVTLKSLHPNDVKQDFWSGRNPNARLKPVISYLAWLQNVLSTIRPLCSRKAPVIVLDVQEPMIVILIATSVLDGEVILITLVIITAINNNERDYYGAPNGHPEEVNEEYEVENGDGNNDDGHPDGHDNRNEDEESDEEVDYDDPGYEADNEDDSIIPNDHVVLNGTLLKDKLRAMRAETSKTGRLQPQHENINLPWCKAQIKLS
ncbi:hypothetical protein ACROYT_G032813 [Oculina patagonica]